MIARQFYKKSEHILKTSDFSIIYKKGISVRNGVFVMYLLPNQKNYNRLGFSIGSKVVAKAVLRNQIRRFFREFYRKNKAMFKIGFDIIIVARKPVVEKMTYRNTSDIFIALTSRANIKNEVFG